jgi:hypothetical protein
LRGTGLALDHSQPHDIACDIIMTKRKLAKLRRQFEALRRRSGSVRPTELESIAKGLGRKRHDRGKEPTYEWPNARRPPLTIPRHPGTLKKGTACNILDQLEEDIELLEQEDDSDNDGGDR